MAYIFGSIWDRRNRNALNELSKSIEYQGKSIQDLVAEGQLTPTQYATLIQSVNGLISKGEVSALDINKNLGKFDSTYFSSDFIRELNDGVINTTELLPDSVTDDKIATNGVNFLKHTREIPLVFKTRPKNLFNKNTARHGFYVNRVTGEDLVDDTYASSRFIPVTGGLNYIRSSLTTGAWYDADNNYISGIAFTDNLIVKAPINAKYLRVSVRKNEIDNYMVVQGDTLGDYEPYYTDLKVEHDDYMNPIKLESISTEFKSRLVITDTPSKNLFDKKSVTSGYYVDHNTGELLANANYSASEFISVEGDVTYSFKYNGQGAWYDADKNYISGIAQNITKDLSPQNAGYLRISTRLTDLDTQMVVQGETTGDYEPFSRGKFNGAEYIKSKSITPDLLSNSIVGGGLETPSAIARDVIFTPGSTIDLWGDSRTHGSGGTGYSQDGSIIPGTDVKTSPNSHSWANSLRDLLQSKYDVTVRNYGQSGMNSNHLLSQAPTLLSQNPDMVIIMIGTNDRHNIDSVSGHKNNVRQIVQLALDEGVKVVLMSAPPTSVDNDNEQIRNFGMYDIDKTMNELAYEFGMGYISNYDAALIFSEYRNINPDDLLADGLHENDLGHDVIFRNVVRNLGISYVREGVTK